MWDLIVSVPDHCLSFYFVVVQLIGYMNSIQPIRFLPIFVYDHILKRKG